MDFKPAETPSVFIRLEFNGLRMLHAAGVLFGVGYSEIITLDPSALLRVSTEQGAQVRNASTGEAGKVERAPSWIVWATNKTKTTTW